MSHAIICLNGQFLPAEEARIPVTDRGFRFGDSVFETMRIHKGVPYQWALHLARLMAGLQAISIDIPAMDWQKIAFETLQKNQTQDGFLRIQISRGVGSQGYLPHAAITPNYVIERLPPSPEPLTELTRVILSDIRKIPLQCLPGNHKIGQGLNSTLALMEAQAKGFDDALQLTIDGKICETASANIFWIIGDQIFTPSLATGCLAGTTRAAIMRLTNVQEAMIDLNDIKQSEAVFISNVRLGINQVIGFGHIGSKMHPRIRELKARYRTDMDAHTDENCTIWSAK